MNGVVTVSNTHQLQLMGVNLSGSYQLATNIDATETAGTNTAGIFGPGGFVPVGNNSTRFTGALAAYYPQLYALSRVVAVTPAYGSANPTLIAGYAGVQAGDFVTTLGSLTTTATSASHVAGSPYAITASGAASTDYTISYVAGALSVTPAPLSVTADAQSRIYGMPTRR